MTLERSGATYLLGCCLVLLATPSAAQENSIRIDVGRLYDQLLDLWELRSIEARHQRACLLNEKAERLRDKQRQVAQEAEEKLVIARAENKPDVLEEIAVHVQAKVLLEEVTRVNGYAQAMCFAYGDKDLRLAD